MQLADIVSCSARVAATSRRLEKIAELAELLARLDVRQSRIAVSYLCGQVPQTKLGIGPAFVYAALEEQAAPEPCLTLLDVDSSFASIARASGAGSASQRRVLLTDLFRRATNDEQRFLARLSLG